MKNIKMNKKGFTLSELLMVLAIIVILSGATAIGIVSSINKAKENAAKLEQNNGNNFESEAMEAVLTAKGTVGSDVVNQTSLDTPTPAETTKTPAETTKKPAETTRTPAETTKAPAETTSTPVETTKAPEETTKPASSTTANFGTATNGFTGYYNNGNPGLMSLTASGSNGITIQITDGYDNNNPSNDTCTATIVKKSDGNYYLTVNSGNGWVAWLVASGYNYSADYKLSSSDISNFQSKLGLKLN